MSLALGVTRAGFRVRSCCARGPRGAERSPCSAILRFFKSSGGTPNLLESLVALTLSDKLAEGAAAQGARSPRVEALRASLVARATHEG